LDENHSEAIYGTKANPLHTFPVEKLLLKDKNYICILLDWPENGGLKDSSTEQSDQSIFTRRYYYGNW